MPKTLLDGGLKSWEAFASTGPYGYADQSVVVFRCTSDPDERPRAIAVSGDKSDAETRVATATRKELLEMLERAEPIQ
jgi:hypothetical protein